LYDFKLTQKVLLKMMNNGPKSVFLQKIYRETSNFPFLDIVLIN